MKKKKLQIRNRNVRVLAENSRNRDGFNIYLDFSGQREYLMFHQRNGLLYHILKDGIPLPDLRRWKISTVPRGSSRRYRSRRSVMIKNIVDDLLAVVDSYLMERDGLMEWELCHESATSFHEAA